MHLKFLLVSLLIFNTFIIGCSNNNINSETKFDKVTPPEELYEIAINELKEDKLDEAKIKFEVIEKEFPLSSRAIQSKVMLAFIDYLKLNYNEAIYSFNAIIELYPSYKDLDYVYYMRALSYYEQINIEGLEGQNNLNSLNYFNQLINRFPESQYAKDSRQKIILVKENIAAKHMNIALYSDIISNCFFSFVESGNSPKSALIILEVLKREIYSALLCSKMCSSTSSSVYLTVKHSFPSFMPISTW